MKLIIAGGKDFTNYIMLKDSLNKLLANINYDTLEIVSGSARGADKIGERLYD